MSGRGYFLKMREWELDSMKGLCEGIGDAYGRGVCAWFFYSFQIPRLGKEFDLLQVREDQIVNVELKSGAVSDEALRKQLIQNRYYLAVQGKTIRSYTYISSQNRLARLTNHDRIVDADWEQLCADLRDGGKDYGGRCGGAVSGGTVSDLASHRAGAIPEQGIFPDCPAAGYRTPDLKENPGGADRGVLVYGTSGTGKTLLALRYRYEAFREAEGLHDPLRGEQ